MLRYVMETVMQQAVQFEKCLFKIQFLTASCRRTEMASELDMDWIHPWIGLDSVGWLRPPVFHCSYITSISTAV